MKRIGAGVCILIVLLMQAAMAEGLFENKPDWLTGILSIDLYGADFLEESWPLDRFVCAFDFGLEQVEKVKIPEHAFYTKEWQDGGDPIVIHPSEYGYYYMDRYSVWKWREVNFVEIMRMESENGVRYTFGEPTRDIWTGEATERSPEDNNVYYDTFFSESPMWVLGVKREFETNIMWDRLSAYYLQYGLSEKGSLEIQLVREDDAAAYNAKQEILYRFPLDYDFGAWQYSISKNGSIVWVEDANTLICADEYGITRFVSTNMILGKPVWYDENSVLYFETENDIDILQTETVLKKWNVANDAAEDFQDANGQRIEGNISPFTMALNDRKDVLAVYGWTGGETNIKMINLESGDAYMLNPWPNWFEEEYDPEKMRYGFAADGTVYFDPAASIQSQLVWFPE